MVFISGGLDVSFPALSSLTLFITLRVFEDYTGSPLVPMLFIIVISGLLGMLNGVVIAKYNFAPLIVTLATESLFWGLLHGVVKGTTISMLPESFQWMSKTILWTATNSESGLSSHMPFVLFPPS